MTPQQAINQLKRDGFLDREIIEAVLPMVKEKFWVVEKKNEGNVTIKPGHTFTQDREGVSRIIFHVFNQNDSSVIVPVGFLDTFVFKEEDQKDEP